MSDAIVLPLSPSFKNLTGHRFTRLLVVSYAGKYGANRWSAWNCKCDCGGDVVAPAQHLTRGNIKSCGCYHADMARQRRRPPIDRFNEKVNRGNGDGCFLWTARKNEDGYGVFHPNRDNTWLAHRWLYHTLVAPVTGDIDVLHICDNPPCVRLDHLKPGTHADNMRDMAQKGRGSFQMAARASLRAEGAVQTTWTSWIRQNGRSTLPHIVLGNKTLCGYVIHDGALRHQSHASVDRSCLKCADLFRRAVKTERRTA